MTAIKEATTLKGTYGWHIFSNESKSFSISALRLAPESGTKSGEVIKYVGSFPSFERGTPLVVRGCWEEHSKYGPQFKALSVELDPDASLEALQGYLASGLIPGIGGALAVALVQKFGQDTLRILEEDPQRLLEVRGIGKGRLRTIIDGWHDHRERREIITSLQVSGFTLGQAAKIYDDAGTNALAVLARNPYELLEIVQGLSYKSVDLYALTNGFALKDSRRLLAGIVKALDYGVLQGHAFYPFGELCSVAHRFLTENLVAVGYSLEDLTLRDVFGVVEELSGEDCFVRDTFPDSKTKVYLPKFYEAERNIPTLLLDLLRASYSEKPLEAYEEALSSLEESKGIKLSSTQREGVLLALSNKVSVITGGPGTGKTTICQFILDILSSHEGEIALVSPTGRAAKRLSEVTGYPSQTIHRLLHYSPSDKGAFQFNSYNPLPVDVVLLDEASMVDLTLFAALLDALPSHARFIIVGDSDQLPSVRPGVVLRDILNSRIPSIRLQEIYRQGKGSLIVDNAHQINGGKRPVLHPLSKESLEAGHDFLFWGADDFDSAKERVMAFVSLWKSKGKSFEDFQVLMPKKRGSNGTQALNPCIRDLVNPPSEDSVEVTFGEFVFREGDRVIQTVNDYDLNVFNGDVGVLKEIDSVNQLVTVTFPDQEVVYPYRSCKNLELAYALTIHKSQGSEYHTVMMIMLPEYKFMLYRNLFYTGVTRAKKRLILVSNLSAIDQSVSVPEDRKRNTLLADRLNVTL